MLLLLTTGFLGRGLDFFLDTLLLIGLPTGLLLGLLTDLLLGLPTGLLTALALDFVDFLFFERL